MSRAAAERDAAPLPARCCQGYALHCSMPAPCHMCCCSFGAQCCGPKAQPGHPDCILRIDWGLACVHIHASVLQPTLCTSRLPAALCLRVVDAAARSGQVAAVGCDSLASVIAKSCCATAGSTSSASLCTAASSLQSAFAAAASLPFEMDSDEPAASPSPDAAAERLARRSESEPLAPVQQPAIPKPKSAVRSVACCVPDCSAV